MKTSANGRSLIEAYEGLFLKAYKDSAGIWTIGYGHTTAAGGKKVYPGMRITAKEADEFLADDLSRVEKRVSRAIKVPLNQNQFDALVSFDFNTGKIFNGSVDDKINAGLNKAAMNTLEQYKNATVNGKLTPLNGLIRRRKSERMMFEGDIEGSLKLAGAKVHAQEKPVESKSILSTIFKFIKSILERFINVK